MQKTSLVLGLVLAGTVGFAIAWGSRDVGASAASSPPHTSSAAFDQQDMHPSDESEQPGPVDPNQQLPPNHPSIGGGAEAPTLTWTAPKEWTQAQNPNAMRLATYKLPRGTDKDETELVVARAGGDVGTNVARWASQFDGSPAPKQTQKTVHDLKVTIVQIEGTYQGGMGPQTGSHPNWAMLGGIVETKGESYFFKVIGPAATVRAARKPFETMIDGIEPS